MTTTIVKSDGSTSNYSLSLSVLSNHWPLHQAVKDGNIEAVKFLLDVDFKTSYHDNEERSALAYACMADNLDIFELLFHLRGPTNLVEHACKYGSLKVLKFLTNKGMKTYCALHAACGNGHMEIVKYLVENGYDMDNLDGHKNPALYYAVAKGYLEIVDYLVNKGAKPYTRDNYIVGLNEALKNGHFETVRYLLNRYTPKNIHRRNVLEYPSKRGDLEMVKYLVSKGADINYIDDFAPGILVALNNGHMDLFRYFIEKGPDMGKYRPAYLEVISKGMIKLVNTLDPLKDDSDSDSISFIESD